jgi:hypothetical protein
LRLTELTSSGEQSGEQIADFPTPFALEMISCRPYLVAANLSYIDLGTSRSFLAPSDTADFNYVRSA